MEITQPPPDMDVEATFNEFVEDFGGELISKIFKGEATRPNNADYFFRDRTVVAELKCLEKNFFNDRKVGDKLKIVTNRWAREGALRLNQSKGEIFHLEDLPEQCAAEVLQIFRTPMKHAVEKANKQIKVTKKYFGIPDAKGLLIIANDGNYSIGPKLMMQLLWDLLESRYTSLDSYIFFTPNMRAYAPQFDRQFNVWISGPIRQSSNAVEPELLQEINQGWGSFLERKYGESITRFRVEDHDVIDDIKLVR